ncbi:hypothetical protein L0F63_000881 [Massospora cicadina]|nr:hypothetical protein L0F63_000881 [Massospora cicadina]
MFTTPQAKRGRAPDQNFLPNDDDFEKRERRKTVLDLKRKRPTLLPSPRKKPRPLPVLTTLSVEEINRRYEEWMKIAADNKINTTNTWNFELIDYFSKLSFFRDGNTINFQKASCTLDGCVKIYTSRVDSVVSETGILLNGLAESSAQRTKALVEEFEEGAERAKKKPLLDLAVGANLGQRFGGPESEKFRAGLFGRPALQKDVRRLRRGGARGLLLNHLFTQGDGRLIFDASDATLKVEDVDTLIDVAVPIDREAVGLDPLRALLKQEAILHQEICPSLHDFQFGFSLALDFNEEKARDDSFASEGLQDLPDDHGDFFDAPAEINGDVSFATFAQQAATAPAGEGPRLISNPKPGLGFGLLADSDNIYSYFDSRFMKNWAGPEHWKLKPIAPTKPKEVTQGGEPKSKAAKSHFEINFMGLDTDTDYKALFAKGQDLINSKLYDRTSDSHLLPDDLHFTSQSFLRLFCKPTFSLKPKHFRIPGREDRIAFEVEAEGARDYEMDDNGYDGGFSNGYGSDNPGELEDQNTVFGAALDNPDTLFDMNTTFFEKEINHHKFGEQLVPALRRIQAVRVNYMRIAKRVDVKLLKDNLWRKLNPTEPEATPVLSEHAEPVQSAIQPQPFSHVVKSLSDVYPLKKFNDLSVPFCFICLLHLANEHNLEIQSNPEMNELVIKAEDSANL